MAISDNLTLLNSTKQDIKAAIAAKGVDMTSVPFTDYDTKIGEISSGTPIVYQTWERPADWITVPTITSTSEKVYVLFAVNNVPLNGIMFVNDVSAITVDWGDGTVENFPAGSYCQHFYDYNDPDLNGSLSTRGYKQALITITPQTTFAAGTLINFNQQPTGYRTNQNVSILEIHFAIANGNIALPTVSYLGSTSCRINNCEYINIKNWNATDLFLKFGNLVGLVKVDIPMNPSSGKYTSASQTFQNCFSLVEPPLFDTSMVAVFANMFENAGIEYCPDYNYSSAVNIRSMFANATKLRYVPDMDIPNVTAINSLFTFCESLQTAPRLINMSSAITDINTMFGWCYNLTYIPDDYNTSNVTNMTSTFDNCRSLKYLPNWDYSKVVQVSRVNGCRALVSIPDSFFPVGSQLVNSQFFMDCISLEHIPDTIVNATVTVSMDNMFQTCHSLRRIPNMTVANGALAGATEFSDVYRDCRSIVEIGTLDLTNNTGITGLANVFFSARSLQKIGIIGLRTTFTIADCSLGSAALDTLYTNLATVTGQTITVTGNPGTTGDNPSIATAKGWTVVG